MTNPTTQQMQDWLNAASPQTKIKYQWVDILLGRLERAEAEIENATTQLHDITTELLNP